tara:strand:- start:3605 stop:5059 length:1455 start_codon:yes stop_codon:yes gene_type:complete
MKMQVYNNLTQKKEEFVPLEEGKVKLYVCGPTVYDLLHVGNFRGPIFFNVLRNWLERLGYVVTYVYNYTDVDDKIIQRALREGVESKEISERYIKEFEQDYAALKLGPHDKNPRVTEHMQDIISLIEKIIENGHAYVVDGEVFYSIESFKEYGKLSHKNIEDLIAGQRVEVDKRKKNPLDFSLWKAAKPGEPKWSSPWGEGRPGWHIECSAMNCALLGEQIDIHGGGMDLIFPHHENEIAQSEAATGKPFAKYWIHNNMINFSGEKMSKSLGNIVKARDYVAEYDPEIFKYIILSSHYRSQVDLSDAQANNAISALARIYSALSLADDLLAANVDEQTDKNFAAKLEEAKKKITTAMCDDFNTPEAFAAIFELIRAFNATYKRGKKINGLHKHNARLFKEFIKDYSGVFALFANDPKKYLMDLDDRLLKERKLQRDDIDALIEERQQARKEKNWDKADAVRAKLDEYGIAVHDTPEGTSWEVQK